MKKFINIILFLLILPCIGSPVRSALGVKGILATGGNSLPYDAEVEWIETSGTQYIDTGIRITDTIRCEALVGIVSGYPDVIIGNCFNDSNDWRFFYPGGSCLDVGNKRLFQNKKMTERVLYDVEFGNTFLTVGGTTSRGTVVSGLPQYKIYVAAKYDAYHAWSYYNVMIRTLKLADGGDVLRDMIAVRFTNENGQTEGAMYDRANPTVGINPDGSARTDGLYRNRGTGEFIIGPDK